VSGWDSYSHGIRVTDSIHALSFAAGSSLEIQRNCALSPGGDSFSYTGVRCTRGEYPLVRMSLDLNILNILIYGHLFMAGPPSSFLAKCYNKASVVNREDNLAIIFLWLLKL
jgi:hypothetical protein